MNLFHRRRGPDAEEFRQLTQRVKRLEARTEKVMADIDTLNAALDSIGTDVDAALAHTTELSNELQAIQSAGTSVDLSGVIAKADAIKAKLEGASTTATTAAAPPAS